MEHRQGKASDWRQIAAARLADILTHRDPGGLLGELLKHLPGMDLTNR